MAEQASELKAFSQRCHPAGPLIGGVQRCTRCDGVLTDYRNCMVKVGSEPLGGWEEGAWILRCGYGSSVVPGPDATFPACEGPARG